jgi:hypothetical protein
VTVDFRRIRDDRPLNEGAVVVALPGGKYAIVADDIPFIRIFASGAVSVADIPTYYGGINTSDPPSSECCPGTVYPSGQRAIPSDFAIQFVSGVGINVSWHPLLEEEYGEDIEYKCGRSIDGEEETYVTTSGSGFTDSDISVTGEYSYRIQTLGDGTYWDDSDWSGLQSLTIELDDLIL